jgi:predicted MPP superfamily phosphohydrolase
MRNPVFVFVLALIMVLVDIYVYQALRVVTPAGSKARLIVMAAYWILSAAALVMVFIMPFSPVESWPNVVRTYILSIMIGLFFSKLVASAFLAVDDIRRGIVWVAGKVTSSTQTADSTTEGITRSAFLSWMGLAIGGGLFSTLLYGFNNKYRYQVNRVKLHFDNLPVSFKGLKMVHISDIHSGSFTDKQAVQRGVEKILKEKPDIIVFTGDLVNHRASEMADYMDVFSQLKAPLGVYSVLGNHDYGDYIVWESEEAKKQNLETLKAVHQQLGWRLLMNEHVVIEKDGEHIALLGIENWSARGNFGKYGKMELAYPGTEKYPFKILLSHDPSHWDAEVRRKYPDINLMLSGHTHGMQFGVEVPGFRWSPVQYMYKQWAGLYEAGNQKLYVNRGYGFIGYPGRVGILPEISVLELV